MIYRKKTTGYYAILYTYNKQQINTMSNLNQWFDTLLPILPLLLLWSILWKGLALWHSGRREHVRWFVILLVVNTLGILEIIYLFSVAKLKLSELFSKKI
jgi:methionyl-tRNA synthetase